MKTKTTRTMFAFVCTFALIVSVFGFAKPAKADPILDHCRVYMGSKDDGPSGYMKDALDNYTISGGLYYVDISDTYPDSLINWYNCFYDGLDYAEGVVHDWCSSSGSSVSIDMKFEFYFEGFSQGSITINTEDYGHTCYSLFGLNSYTPIVGETVIEDEEDIDSPSNTCQLKYQSDGNLVVYCNSNVVWASDTVGPAGNAKMQTDGNFVVYDGTSAVWASNTDGHSGAFAIIADTGEFAIYDGPYKIWSSWD